MAPHTVMSSDQLEKYGRGILKRYSMLVTSEELLYRSEWAFEIMNNYSVFLEKTGNLINGMLSKHVQY